MFKEVFKSIGTPFSNYLKKAYPINSYFFISFILLMVWAPMIGKSAGWIDRESEAPTFEALQEPELSKDNPKRIIRYYNSKVIWVQDCEPNSKKCNFGVVELKNLKVKQVKVEKKTMKKPL